MNTVSPLSTNVDVSLTTVRHEFVGSGAGGFCLSHFTANFHSATTFLFASWSARTHVPAGSVVDSGMLTVALPDASIFTVG
ncbi:MAG: hypothetical protein NZ888_02530 [Candidatus Nitrosocaldus sp.]|nr:hypothetical protein [Candidatus Nitrosocaldus sp.]